jgi:adenine-specific DNA-methyltransferase
VRYIGNKTRLLSFIGDTLTTLGIHRGTAVDAFAGTVSVGAFLKASGFDVTACDLMTYSYVFQRAYLEVDEYPRFQGLMDDPAFRVALADPRFAVALNTLGGAQGDLLADNAAGELTSVLLYLSRFVEPETGFIASSFSAVDEASDGRRMYFTLDNGMRIDAIRRTIHQWQAQELITAGEYHVLLAALIDAADAVANTTGVYAAYVKTWQPNARRGLQLQLPHLVIGTGRQGRAIQGDIGEEIRQVGPMTLLYLDPPYNTRQYSAYYHIPELLATGWFESEPALRGKTGLLRDAHLKSEWSNRSTCVGALERLIGKAGTDHILMSYNSEGIIPEPEIERILRAAGKSGTYRRFARSYARYRSDSDSDSRRYKANGVSEYLYYVRVR